MAKRINYQLTNEELKPIEKAMAHDPCSEVVQQATAIRLLHQGHKHEKVGEMLSASRASVQN